MPIRLFDTGHIRKASTGDACGCARDWPGSPPPPLLVTFTTGSTTPSRSESPLHVRRPIRSLRRLNWPRGGTAWAEGAGGAAGRSSSRVWSCQTALVARVGGGRVRRHPTSVSPHLFTRGSSVPLRDRWLPGPAQHQSRTEYTAPFLGGVQHRRGPSRAGRQLSFEVSL